MKALIEACDEFAANVAKEGKLDSVAASLDKMRAEMNREGPWTLLATLTLLTAAARKDDGAFAGFLKKCKLGETELSDMAKRMSDIIDIVKLTETVKASDGSLDTIKAALGELRGKEKETLEALGEKFAVPAKPMRTVATGRNQEGQCDVSGWEDIVSIAAGHRYTVGVRMDGTLIFTGKDYPSISDWKGISTIAAQGEYVAGLRENGTVVTSFKADVSGWKNISAIAVGQGDFSESNAHAHIVGLREDGTVAAAGCNEDGQCNVSGWANVVSIAAFDYCTLGVREDGTVLRTGRSPDCDPVSVSDLKNIAAVAVRTGGISKNIFFMSNTIAMFERVAVLRKDGTVDTRTMSKLTSHGRDMKSFIGNNNYNIDTSHTSQLRDITAIALSRNSVIGLCKNGTVAAVGDSSISSDVSTWEDIAVIAAGGSHVVGLQKYQ
jgi:alpha-tubulin suppressor-like RCC1 family protein